VIVNTTVSVWYHSLLSLAIGVTLAGVALRLLLVVRLEVVLLASNHVVTLSATFTTSHLRLSCSDHHVLLLLLYLLLLLLLLSLIIGHGCKA